MSNTTGGGGSSSSSTRRKLSQLSASCRKHQSYHEGQRIDSITVEEESQVPTFCRSVLNSLRKILPKLEQQAHHADDWLHLCECYQQIVTGGFCPHAPHLFLLGKQGGREVFRRIHLLFQASLKNDNPLLCRTIAQLLAWIPEQQTALRQEWVELTADVGILVEDVTLLPAELPLVGGLVQTIPNLETAREVQETLWSVLQHWWGIFQEEQICPAPHTSPVDDKNNNNNNLFVEDTSELYCAARAILLNQKIRKGTFSSVLKWLQHHSGNDEERLVAQAAVFHLHHNHHHHQQQQAEHYYACKKLATAVGNLQDTRLTRILLLDGLSSLSDKSHTTDRPVLEQAVLRTLHRFLCCMSPASDGDVRVEQATLQTLLRWLREPSLQDLSLWVLSKVLSVSNSDDLDDLCRIAATAAAQQPQQQIEDSDNSKRPRENDIASIDEASSPTSKRPRTTREGVSMEDNNTWFLAVPPAGYATPASIRAALEWLFRRAASGDRLADTVSVLRLLLHCNSQHSVVVQNFMDSLVNGILLSRVKKLRSDENSNEDHNCHMEMIITCGVHLPPGKFASFRAAARELFQSSRPQQQQQQQQQLPIPLLESLYHAGLSSLQHVDTTAFPVVRATCFDTGVVHISHDGATYTGIWEGPFAATTLLKEAEASHLERLRHLLPHVRQPYDLRQLTCDALRQNCRASDGPETRLRRWQCLAWLLRTCPPDELRRLLLPPPQHKQHSWIQSTLLDTAFADEDDRVREYASRELGSALAASWDGVAALLAAAEDDWHRVPARELTERFFRHVDNLLHEHCCVPQSQLSFTVGSTSANNTDGSDEKQQERTRVGLFQRSAVQSLLSLCQEPQSALAQRIFVAALTRVLRLWATNEDGLRRGKRQWICFAEISHHCRSVNLARIVRDQCMDTITPSLFREILVPSSSVLVGTRGVGIENIRPETRERQCSLLSTFMQSFLLNADGEHAVVAVGRTDVTDLERYLEVALPFVFAQLIVEKDYDSLRLTTLYKLFLLAQKRFESKRRNRVNDSGVRIDQAADLLLGGYKSTFAESSLISRVWAYDLQEQTGHLCMSECVRILPLVLMTAGRSELFFYSKVVLRDRNSLKNTIVAKDRGLLKELVWQVGASNEMQKAAVRAIKIAALARSEDLDSGREITGVSMSLDSSVEAPDVSALSEWVTSHFMFLLVNLVQYKWRTRSNDERIQALRGLCFILDLLRSGESPQYFPQIMATFNAAATPPDDSYSRKAHHVQLLAVQALSKFVRLVAKDHCEILGQNLNVVVVSLIPIVPGNDTSTNNEFQFRTGREAVSLLEWLTEGELGQKLAGFFSEIPFMPSSPALETVRASLRGLGVDFDNVITTQGTQEGMSRQSLPSMDGSVSLGNESSGSSYALRQAALRRRLGIVCTLLSNENTGIRQVVLKHATDLIRANREVFHALVENEGDTSMKHYITVAHSGTAGASRGTVTEFIEALLNRCVNETNEEARISLAACIGEVGAIAAHNLEERPTSSHSDDKPKRCPWHSRADRYELQLVTNQLVAALRAAPSSTDQHKIAFTIQQILALLDRSASEGESVPRAKNPESVGKPAMNNWLRSKLSEAGVLEVVEPFWTTEFCETETSAAKQPPFFRHATSYFGWMSNWCRFMVLRSYNKRNKWSELFYACRTSLRTHVGLGVAEFLLPVLVLDRICFGDGHDDQTILTEVRDALTFGAGCTSNMIHSERQKVVSTLLDLVDTLQIWSETEAEARRPQSSSSRSAARKSSGGDHWPVDESVLRIDDTVAAIPLSLRAQAAATVGMHARALRLFEMLARSQVASAVFNGSSPNHEKRTRSRAAGICGYSDLTCMKETLGALNDYETMACLMDDENGADPTSRIRGSIKLKEVSSNWEGALQDYERALQIQGSSSRDPRLQQGALRCLLELGHFDSVLNQVSGFLSDPADSTMAEGSLPLAMEASWRLGNWDALAGLVTSFESGTKPSNRKPYEVSQSQIMLNLKNKNLHAVVSCIRDARAAVMEKLSIAASEGYSRSYGHIVRLHGLREAEDVAELLCSDHHSVLGDLVNDVGFGWDWRLDTVSSAGITALMNGRLALARLAGDSAFEGALFLDMGRRARKTGLKGMAASALAQAEAAFHFVGTASGSGLTRSSLQIQFAKLKHECGESSTALRMLHNEDMESMVNLVDADLRAEAVRRVNGLLGTDQHGMPEDQAIEVFAKSAIQSTKWIIEGGLKGGSEIISRFRILHRLAPKWEKGHFYFAKYVDSILQSRIAALHQRSPDVSGGDDELVQGAAISQDKTCQRYVLLAIKHYVEALVVDMKHVYQALPRLLSLWFEFTSIGKTDSVDRRSEGFKLLLENQEEANASMANKYKQIPAPAFYTALPQLISRIKHPDKNSTLVVRGILRRVLTKYPAQAMWPLAWLRQSRQKDRCKAGDEIFREAERLLMKSPNKTLHSLLVASKSLFVYFQKLAKFEVRGARIGEISVKGWKGEVDLVEFIPPVQAALSASLSCGDSGRSRDLFPRHVPRMRAFASRIQVMSSKARPKIIKAYVVSADNAHKYRSKTKRTSKDNEHDIGEVKFLVKQEAKGDLRKDARVQDLNNVINRLMASTSNSGGSSDSQQRRLRLRTFAVTCLSEDTGILEWVPGTSSFRSLVAKAYNPQASTHSSRRSGSRLANFGDPMLKSHYDKCQKMFFESKDLKAAAKLFEELCLKPHPPLFYWWFVQSFPDPHAWYEARTRFTLSSAAWSAIGHVIGVGDRHSENILLDTESGECVHVDFDCIFDKGLHLPKPEVIPFRLTQNMLDAFGPTGADGVFSGSLKTAMRTLRNNRDTLLSVLEPFLKDPVIDWKRYRSQQQSTSSKAASSEERQTREAKRSINVIDERLRGIYNLRNPNYKRIRPIHVEQGEDGHVLPLSVEGQVHKMIAEATSNENLVQMYIGWMPWI